MNHVLILITVLLSGCAVSPSLTFPPKPTADTLKNSVFGEIPNSYESVIKQYAEETLIDPDSAKFSNFTTPIKSWLSDGKIGGKIYIGWFVLT